MLLLSLALLLLGLVGLVLLLELQGDSSSLLPHIGHSEIIGLLLSLLGLDGLLLLLLMLAISITGLLYPHLELLITGSLGSLHGWPASAG